MSLQRGIDGGEPLRPEPVTGLAGVHEERRDARHGRLAVGTLACPSCDAPIALAGAASPGAGLLCPFCDHAGRVRDFLSLDGPPRPARVAVRVRERRRAV